MAVENTSLLKFEKIMGPLKIDFFTDLLRLKFPIIKDFIKSIIFGISYFSHYLMSSLTDLKK
jgi:hypothetical protein|tara:strand:- start:189 stop:374 length:186 start_codon:yes stop_codon:yes gene_type:complete